MLWISKKKQWKFIRCHQKIHLITWTQCLHGFNFDFVTGLSKRQKYFFFSFKILVEFLKIYANLNAFLNTAIYLLLLSRFGRFTHFAHFIILPFKNRKNPSRSHNGQFWNIVYGKHWILPHYLVSNLFQL